MRHKLHAAIIIITVGAYYISNDMSFVWAITYGNAHKMNMNDDEPKYDFLHKYRISNTTKGRHRPTGMFK